MLRLLAREGHPVGRSDILSSCGCSAPELDAVMNDLIRRRVVSESSGLVGGGTYYSLDGPYGVVIPQGVTERRFLQRPLKSTMNPIVADRNSRLKHCISDERASSLDPITMQGAVFHRE